MTPFVFFIPQTPCPATQAVSSLLDSTERLYWLVARLQATRGQHQRQTMAEPVSDSAGSEQTWLLISNTVEVDRPG